MPIFTQKTKVDYLLNLPESNPYAPIKTDPFYINLPALIKGMLGLGADFGAEAFALQKV